MVSRTRWAALIALLALAAGCEVKQPLAGPEPEPAAVTVVAPDGGLTVAAATVVPIAPAVRVVDAEGRGVQGIAVYFAVRPGSGTVDGATQRTDADGVARVERWRLSGTLGPQFVDAYVGAAGFETPAPISVTSVVGPPVDLRLIPDTLILASGASVQIGAELTDVAGHLISTPPAPIQYASDHVAVASVSTSGVITAAGPGNTNVRAVMNTLDASVAVATVGPSASPNATFLSTNRLTMPIVVMQDGHALAGAPGGGGFRFRAPFPAVSPWTEAGVVGLAHAPGEPFVYGIISASGFGVVAEYAADGSRTRTFFAATATPLSIAVAPALDAVFVGETSGTLRRFDRTTGAQTSVALSGAIHGITVHPTDGRLFVTTQANLIVELDGATLAVLRSEALDGLPRRSALIDGNASLVVTREALSPVIVDVATLAITDELSEGTAARDVVVSPDGSTFVVAFGDGGTLGKVVRYDMASRTVTRTDQLGRPLRLAFDPSGYVLYVTADNTVITVLR